MVVVVVVVAGCSAAPGSDLVIDRVDPASATNTAAVRLRVEGTGFHLPLTSDLDRGSTVVGDMAVSVGDVPLEAAVWRGEQLIEGSVPMGLAPGSYDVTVRLGDRSGVLASGYVVIAVDDPSADRDGDSVPDSSDVCPDDFDPAQYDHDSDLRGDVCDRCPHIASSSDPDQDGDGVGDDCDPRPTLPGDQRTLWVGFYDSDAVAVLAWPGSGMWSVSGGMLNELGTSTTTFDYKGPPGTVARGYVATAVRFNAMQGTSWTAAVGTGVVGTLPNPQQFYECFTLSGGASPFVAAQSSAFGRASKPRPTIAAGAINEIVIDLTARHDCTFTEGGFRETTTLGINTTAGKVHVSSQRATVSFDYLFVVESGG